MTFALTAKRRIAQSRAASSRWKAERDRRTHPEIRIEDALNLQEIHAYVCCFFKGGASKYKGKKPWEVL